MPLSNQSQKVFVVQVEIVKCVPFTRAINFNLLIAHAVISVFASKTGNCSFADKGSFNFEFSPFHTYRMKVSVT